MKVQDDKLAAIKAATSLLIHRVGGAEAAAMVCRASVQVLYEYASPHRPDRVIPVDVAMQLETFLGEPVVTATLARLQGLTVARPDDAGVPDISRAVGLAAQQAGALASLLLAAQADNHLDDSERVELRRVAESLLDAARATISGLAAPAALRVVA